ncbi:hypothetical protein ABZZ01_17165 [Streptomyces virginiae]|uniref:hypothetical protein n=1 Tax=Streptomyces virginiae TaxID=1961 RepID=UPI0033A33F6A
MPRAQPRVPLVPAEWQVEVLVRWLADEVRAGVYDSEGGLPETGLVARLFEIDYPLADEAVRQLIAQGHMPADRWVASAPPVPPRSSATHVAATYEEALDRAQVVSAAADALMGWRRHEARTPRAIDAQQIELHSILRTLTGSLSSEPSQRRSQALVRARFLAVAPGPFPAWARPWHIAWLGLAVLALLEAHPELLAPAEACGGIRLSESTARVPDLGTAPHQRRRT